ncbi:galactose-1-phosphate uridylyltransferase [Levilactobacillus koreensis JCM 16448]|uniref:Galactose-1-phosphate uridylyltransferase n=1 Tax=Levilactobacillus koreensis TaxID=637971 RepID=A0AAC8UW08_9LACO|nr:UDP-glucose--hexose-1-phosphate uridylyltransferase [Levilactobacillus koreensis]AKP65066.1 galactose-1-phosphate uridylyltransferase [Levilactobacillus koreensis]KRK86702.1 galactose-1-phosphate uridylyltransferase [Levilactobacillus koreensis JCM 16448]
MAEDTIQKFIDHIVSSPAPYTELDRQYVTNRIFALIGDGEAKAATADTPIDLVNALIETAIDHGKIEDSPSPREILESQLMDLMTPLPSAINRGFWDRYQESPSKATDWFYQLSQANNYIKTRNIAKNVVFPAKTAAGELEITINLSKPEKDPKAIAAAQTQKQTSYPLDQLCMTNEGYLGRLGYPARSNHRIIRMMLGGETWGFQYSPYAYFSEHAIFLAKEHRPMVINQHTFTNLLEIVRTLPTYFVGSNADLPIVGGSMLTHDHYQGGKHSFPMMKASIDRPIDLGVAGVTAGVVDWPMTDIRLTGSQPEALINAATKVLDSWIDYSDESVDVRAYTDNVRHHTITPIAYRDGADYVLDLVLRDNQTSAQYPDGIFHPHQDVQHIKKENIGLIEVMGRAILPARLKTEMAEVTKYLLDQPNQMADMHKAWADSIKQNHALTAENVTPVLHQAIGDVFARVLADAGVFKRDAKGQAALDKFIAQI